MNIEYTKTDPNVIIIGIPEIGVSCYYLWRLDDAEDDNHFHQRAMGHAYELIRRHDTGQPYFIGYRHVPQDDRLHMVSRKIEMSGGRVFEKVMGIDTDFVEVFHEIQN